MSKMLNQTNGRRRTMLVCLVMLTLSISAVLAQKPATSGQKAQQLPETVGMTAIPVKFCEGKYSKKNLGLEAILSAQCTTPEAACECSNSGVKCGGRLVTPQSGSVLVEGSCKTTIVPDK